MSGSTDPFAAAAELEDDASYDWWRNTHPTGVILSIRARRAPLLHRASCPDVDRGRHPGALKARGSRQVCGPTSQAIRAWLAAHEPGSSPVIERCPKCSP